MATTNLDSAKLKAAAGGPWIHEDLMQAIWDISSIPLEFSDRCGAESADNEYHEWAKDKLRTPDLTNARLDGADTTAANDTNVGTRVGNHCQISTKTVQISSRADASDTVGSQNESAYQIVQRQRELRRDREAIMLSNQGSVADDGNTIAGTLGSVFAFCTSNVNHGATGSGGGFNTGTKLIAAVVAGTKRPLTETMVRDTLQAVYLNNGNPDTMMARPALIRKFSEYCFTSSARIATLMNDEGPSDSPMTAKGSVNVFVTDFGISLKLIPNRLQPESGGAGTQTTNVLLADFSYIKIATLRGYQVEPLAKSGLSEKNQMSVDATLVVTNEEGIGAIYDIDTTATVTT
jgi:hypothetical protein